MTDRTAHARLIKLGADILKQRHWGDRINTAEAKRQDDALAALGYEAGQIAKMIAAPSQPEGARPTALAKLRHLYANMLAGEVRDTASAKRIATGLLGPAIEALEAGAAAPDEGKP